MGILLAQWFYFGLKTLFPSPAPLLTVQVIDRPLIVPAILIFNVHNPALLGRGLLIIAPVGSIQRILGLENRTTTTEIYLHSIGDLEREATNAFEWSREKSHTVGTQKKRELSGKADNSLI